MFMSRLTAPARRAAGLALVLAAISGAAHAGSSPLKAGSCPPVPEIDAGSLMSAATLLSGGLLVLTDRRRPK